MTIQRLCLILLCLNVTIANADDVGLIDRWQFDRNSIKKDIVTPAAGTQQLRIVGPVEVSKDSPQALLLSGNVKQRQHVVINDDLSAANLPKEQLTVEAWLQVDATPEWGGICGVIQDNGSHERGWLLGSRRSAFSFAVATKKTGRLTYLTSERKFEEGHWYHVVGTFDGTIQRIYVDGQIEGESRTQSGPIAYPEKGVYCIGAYLDDNEFYPFTGKLERVSVFNRSLAAEEILASFAERKANFPGIDTVIPQVSGWPTYLRDNQRSGISDEEIRPPLHLQWVHKDRHEPRPAWPAPAKQDFWHRKSNLKPRVTYDRAYHLVSVDNRVYFGSSTDDRICCLNATTGETVWTYFTEGPVRLAPTVSEGLLLCGSDDGHVYCLDATSGELQWKFRHDVTDRRIPGNSRLISTLPVRSGVLVEAGVAYFCTGLFPKQGTFQFAVDVATGKEIASGTLAISPQGYLERRSGRLFVSTGRDPAGAFIAKLARRGKGGTAALDQIPAEFPFAFIGAGDVRFGGGDGKLAAFQAEDGKKIWEAEIEGKSYSLAIDGGRLFASTDQGAIYCFASKESTPQAHAPAKPLVPSYTDEREQRLFIDAAELSLAHLKSLKGYCLILGSGDGRLAYEIAKRSSFQVVGVEMDPNRVESSRRMLDAAGLYGRVVIHHAESLDRLHYSDYLFNLIVSGTVVDGEATTASRPETLRVLRPNGGVAVLGRHPQDLIRRDPLPGVGEWTHMYANAANTVCSSDTHVGSQLSLQWFGDPGPELLIDRHHRTVAPLFKSGRLFVPGDNRVIGVDGYNGTVLWNVPIPNSRRVGAFRDCSYMTATDDFLYVASEGRCYGVASQTGEKQLSFSVPTSDESKRDWGYVATIGKTLLGSTTQPGASRRGHSRETIVEGTYFDERPLVCSDSLFAQDRHSGDLLWKYEAKTGAIINSTITVGAQQVMFLESASPDSLVTENGRVRPQVLLGDGSRLVAIDMATGNVRWTTTYDFSAIEHNVFGSYANGKLVMVGTRNSSQDRAKARVVYDVHVFLAETGKPSWSHAQMQSTRANGDHGEQDHHPVIVGDTLYVEPAAYHLHSGTPVKNFGWTSGHRRGCGTMSASSSALYFRQSNPTLFDLTTNKFEKVTNVTRPGCWINMIPAGGLLLIPEGSSGCTCNYAVQTSLAFLPVKKEPAE